jgi:hypothetical protein
VAPPRSARADRVRARHGPSTPPSRSPRGRADRPRGGRHAAPQRLHNTNSTNPDLISGKKLFASKCGSCHVLSRAGTKGTSAEPRPGLPAVAQGRVGPDEHPRCHPRPDPVPRGTSSWTRPVGGRAAAGDASEDRDRRRRRQRRRLRRVGRLQAGQGHGPARQGRAAGRRRRAASREERHARRSRPIPNGQLAYATNKATAPPGKLTVEMPNKSGTPHDIVIDGKGKGEVVQNGGRRSSRRLHRRQRTRTTAPSTATARRACRAR